MVDEKGPLIATLQDGTRIYKRGLVDSRGYVEATIGIYNFSSEFNPNTGKWESVAATLVLPIGNKIEFQPDGDAMKVSIGGSVPVAGPVTIDLAIIIGPDGEISHSIGAGLGAELGGVGLSIGAGFVLADQSSSGVSRHDRISVSPNGDIYTTTHGPASKSEDGKTDYYVTVYYEIFDKHGALKSEGKTGIGDPITAARMSAGIPEPHSNPVSKERRRRGFKDKNGLSSQDRLLTQPKPMSLNSDDAIVPKSNPILLDEISPNESSPGTSGDQNFRNPHSFDDLIQPASYQRPLSVFERTKENELFGSIEMADIGEFLPSVGEALEQRSKMISAQLGRGTNNEQSPAESPPQRPRPKLNPITEGYLKEMPDDGRLILAAEMVGFNGRKEADKAEAARMARFDVQRKMAQDLEDIKVGKVSTVWDRYGHPKAVRDLLGEEAYQSFVDDRLEAGIIANATAGLHLLQDAELFGIADGTTKLEAPHEKLAELMTPKVLAAAAERARDILDMRRTKPSEAVLLSSDLSNRKARFDAAFDANEAVDAEEMDAFLFYHEAAQREIGIAEPGIEMIPPRWASQVAARFEATPVDNGMPTDRRAREAELKQHYTELQQSFGLRTDDVIAYSLARTASDGHSKLIHRQ